MVPADCCSDDHADLSLISAAMSVRPVLIYVTLLDVLRSPEYLRLIYDVTGLYPSEIEIVFAIVIFNHFINIYFGN